MCFGRNIDDVDKTMDEINEQTDNMKQIQDALSAPFGSAADFDEVKTPSPRYSHHQETTQTISFQHCLLFFAKLQDELEAELDELEGLELEDQLLQPARPLPEGKLPARPLPQKKQTADEEDELAALQAEMAL